MKRSRLLFTLLLCALLLMATCLPSLAAAKGHAVYRALNSVGGSFFGHGGVVSAVSGGTPTYVIHAPGSNESPYTVTEVTLSTFKGDGLDYYSAYYMPGYSSSVYAKILNYARQLDDYDVPYIFVNQMTCNLTGGLCTIEVEDITKIRCDGVIEYCYERAGIELLGRFANNAYYWNISDKVHYIWHMSSDHSPQTQRALMTPS